MFVEAPSKSSNAGCCPTVRCFGTSNTRHHLHVWNRSRVLTSICPTCRITLRIPPISWSTTTGAAVRPEPSLRHQAPSAIPGCCCSKVSDLRHSGPARPCAIDAGRGFLRPRNTDLLVALDCGPEWDVDRGNAKNFFWAPIVRPPAAAGAHDSARAWRPIRTWQVSAEATPLPPIRQQYGIVNTRWPLPIDRSRSWATLRHSTRFRS